MKLRATFQENAKVGKAYRVDFKLMDANKIILLKGREQINPRTGEWLGLQGMKHKHLSKKLRGVDLVVIEVDKWKKMSDEDQYAYLYTLSRALEG